MTRPKYRPRHPNTVASYWRRHDLVIQPATLLLIAFVASVLLIIGAVSS